MTTINVKGPIITNGHKWIYDWFGEDATCPRDVIEALPADGSEVEVIVNSGGGYVTQGNEIYTVLKSYSGKVIVTVIEAGSAASVIAMAGHHSRITPVGQIMIHNVSMGAQGDCNAMDKAGEILRKANESISAAYQIKTGLPKEELLQMMDKETWLTAEEAKEKGFVDEIMFRDEEEVKLVASNRDLLPEKIIKKMQNLKKSGELEPKKEAVQESLEAAVEKIVRKLAAEEKPNNKQEPVNAFQRFFI